MRLALLFFLCLQRICADTVYVQMGISSTHIGCVEPELALVEHLLLPRAMWCDTHHCWTFSGANFQLHKIVCHGDTVCNVQLHCDPSITTIVHGAVIALVGLVLVLLFVCIPQARPEYRSKDHQL